MKRDNIQILLGPADLAALMQIPEASVNRVIALGYAPRATVTPNKRHRKWRMADLPAWGRALERLKRSEYE